MKRRYKANLPAGFYDRPTAEVARLLLGKILVHHSPEGLTAGRIVETEAYLAQEDPACHAARGMTRRNAPMFGPAGTAYIYLIYGVHHCFNVVTGKEGEGEAVLIRALEPLCGLDLMQARRNVGHKTKLCSGPGNLCRAMKITPLLNGHPLSRPPLYLAADGYEGFETVTTTRVGISLAAELPLRFYIAGNPCVSRK
ncbi:MAG TPA: DNA-3-methyladenine glycosylase [Firmicutes bacterium]|nr:DNA-3-methyladenine glycosylase [Bacillota bacterium]